MKIRKILLTVLFLTCILSFVACSGLIPAYKVSFVDYDGTLLYEVPVKQGETPVFEGEEPSREATAEYTYTFVGWDKVIAPVSGIVTYKAVYTQTLNKYLVTFVNEDGTVLESKEVEYGQIPTYSSENPQKVKTTDKNYTFAGWDKELVAVTENATYTATYTEAANSYKVFFCDLNGNVLYEEELEYGAVPAYGGETPSLEGDAQYSYEFAGWNSELAPIVGNTYFRPIFTRKVNKYSVTFMDELGNLLQSDEVEYGSLPTFEGELPLPEDDAQYSYEGNWDKEIVSVTGEATYTFLVNKTIRTYTVAFKNGDNVLMQKEYKYGEMPSYDKIPYKASNTEYVYTFSGWNNEVSEVVGDATYVAQYAQVSNTFDVVVEHVTLDGFVAKELSKENLTDKKLYTYTAPAVEGKTPSHQTYNYYFNGEKQVITIYYSDVDVWDGTSVSSSLSGAGTQANPYLITGGADLAYLRAQVNGGNKFTGKYFLMTKSIDLNKNSLMVGKSDDNAFAGIFDGNNCSILNIATKETTTGQYAGLFKVLLAGGKVCNLSTYGQYNQTIKMNGVIVGKNYGTVEGCTNYVSITVPEGVTPAEVHRYTAGIVSYNYGTIDSCVNYGDFSGEEYPSGIVSRSEKGTVSNCINYGTITGKGWRTGGISGMVDAGTVSNCVNFGNVTSGSTNAESSIGGVIGRCGATISNCVNYGYISSTVNKENVGGVVGYLVGSTMSNCVNFGDVKGYQYLGGIAGRSTGVIADCVNNANINGQQWLGGITGRSTKNITGCTNNGNVTGTADFVGGIVGASDGTSRTIDKCTNSGNIKGAGYVGGIDGRPYAGNLTISNCVNSGTVTATVTSVTRGSAGGIVGRTDVALATLINCSSTGTVTAKSAGAYVGLNTTSETTGYVIYDSCSTTLTGNAIGYDNTLEAGISLDDLVYTSSN